MSEFSFVYLFFIMLALCIAALCIIKIRDKKSRVLEEEPDFFDEFYKKKKIMLELNLPKLSITTYIILIAATPIVLTIMLWLLLPNKVFAVFIGVFGVFLPDFVIKLVVEKKKQSYDEKYVRALKAMASALKASMSIQQAVHEVAENPFIADEIKEGFRQIESDIRVGIGVDQAFWIYANKTGSDDAKDMAAAITMQMDVGGSEAAVVETLVKNIEDRVITRKKIKAIFSGTDFMVAAFDIIPFLAIVIIYVGMPDYIGPILDNPLYMTIYVALLVFTVYGSFKIRKKIAGAKGERR